MTTLWQSPIPSIDFQDHFEDLPHLYDIYSFCDECNNEYTYSLEHLEWWKNRISHDSLAFVRIGLALQVIKLKLSGSKARCWRQKFEQICKDTLNASVHYANNVIKAAKVTIELINDGFTKLPSCVAQALPLFKFYSDSPLSFNEELHEKWQEVLDTCGGQITAAHVKAVVEGEEKPKSTIKIDKKLKESLDREARERGIPVAKLLEEIVAERYGATPQNPQESPEGPTPEEEPEYTPEQLEVLDEYDRLFELVVRGELDARAIGPGVVPNSS